MKQIFKETFSKMTGSLQKTPTKNQQQKTPKKQTNKNKPLWLKKPTTNYLLLV